MNPIWILLIGILVVVGGVLALRLHAFLALILGALLVAALTPNQTASVGARVADGFATTAKDVAIVIAMAAIVGEGLLVSGAAERIVLTCRRALGDRHVPLAFLVSAFILGIPLFTVFYLLIPLAKVMRARSGKDYLLYVLSIVAGMTMTHSLIPPAPGPLFAAAALKVDLLTMMAGGGVVAACTALVGYGYAVWANRRWDLPLRDVTGDVDGAATVETDPATLPPLWLSLAPIVLPVLLIGAGAAAEQVKLAPGAAPSRTLALVKQVGEKNVALTIAAGLGLYLIASRKRDRAGSSKAVGDALKEGGVIILITAAGGAFGYVLRQTEIAASLKDLVPAGRLSLLPLAFLVAMLIRTAQGSATVAIITTAGIVAPLAARGALGFHPVYLALAIGCGSKPVMWMNDSGFWIICTVSGFTEAETLKSATVMSAIMGLVGLCVVTLGAWLIPMA